MSSLLSFLRRLPASKSWCGSFLLIAAFLVYAPALGGEFIWDDGYLVGDNPFFKSPIFIFEVFRRYLFLDSFSLYYRPVQNLSYMLDYWIWNQNSFGYHVSNVLFHTASGFLLYLLLKRLVRPLLVSSDVTTSAAKVEATAFFVALIWTIHPIHNAAVAYISGRADSLASMFALGAWLMWLRVEEATSQARQGLLMTTAVIMSLLALCSKEIAIVWLALFCVHVCLFDRSSSWKKKLTVVSAVLGVISFYWCLRHLPAARVAPLDGEPAPYSLRVVLMLRALGDYTGLMFFPYTLHMERVLYMPGSYANAGNWLGAITSEYLSMLGMGALAGATWFCVQRSPGQRLRIFGVLWFVIGFLPISNLFPLNAQSAEHWIYMPSIGFLLFLAGCVPALPAPWQRWSTLVVCVAALGFGARTARRAGDWSHLDSFYTRTILDGGGSPRVHINLASALLSHGEYGPAEKILKETLRRFPNYDTARIALGWALSREGKNQEAEEYLTYNNTEADDLAKSVPNSWHAALYLAHLRYNAKKPEQALTILDEAIQRYPGTWDLLRYKAAIVREKSGPAEAIKVVQAYAAEAWWDSDAQLMLGNLYLAAGENEAAIATFQAAGRLDIHKAEAFSRLAMIELALNRLDEALRYEQEAVKRNPKQPIQYVALASILDKLNRSEESNQAMEKAEKLRQSLSEAKMVSKS